MPVNSGKQQRRALSEAQAFAWSLLDDDTSRTPRQMVAEYQGRTQQTAGGLNYSLSVLVQHGYATKLPDGSYLRAPGVTAVPTAS